MTLYPQARDARGSSEIMLVLSSYGLDFKSFNNNFRIDKSPCCGHHKRDNPSLSMDTEKGLWRCFHCGTTGNWVTFCRLIGHHLSDQDKYVRYEVVNYMDSWENHFKEKPRSPVSSNKYPEIRNYCLKRGISDATLDAFRVSNKWGCAIQIPIFSWHNDTWTRVNARNVRVLKGDDDGPRHWFEVKGGPTHLLLGNNKLDIKDPNKRVFIFEGQWDMFTAYELGLRNVFSLPNGAENVQTAAMLQYVPHDWQVFVCTDMDAAGNVAAEKLFSQIGGDKFRRLCLPYKDLNDWFMAKPDLTAEEVLATARGVGYAQQRQKEAYMDFLDGDDEEEEPLIDTPWNGLSEFLQGGFYAQQVTSLLAPSGSGKTTIVNQIATYTAAAGEKCGLISLEDTPSRLRKKLRQVSEGIGSEKSIRENLLVTQLFGQETTHQQLIVQIDQMILDGCSLVIVDNVNFITGTMIQQLETFRQIINRVKNTKSHVIVVTQPNKVATTKSVNSSDMKGFSDAFQGVFNHINLNRNDSNGELRVMHVEKCRNQDPGPKAFVYLRYDYDHNIYEEVSESCGLSESKVGLRLLKYR